MMQLGELKDWIEGHPWESAGLGGGLAILFFVFLRHSGGKGSNVPAMPGMSLASQRIAANEAIALGAQQERAAVLPSAYAAKSQTAQAGLMAQVQNRAAQLSSKLGLAQIAATLKMSPSGTQQYNLGSQGLEGQVNIAQTEAEAQEQIAANGGYTAGGGYGGNAGYYAASPYGYSQPYDNPAAYLGTGGLGGLVSSVGNLFGGGGGSSAGIDYGGGGSSGLSQLLGY